MKTRCKSAPFCPLAFSSEWGSVFQSHLLYLAGEVGYGAEGRGDPRIPREVRSRLLEGLWVSFQQRKDSWPVVFQTHHCWQNPRFDTRLLVFKPFKADQSSHCRKNSYFILKLALKFKVSCQNTPLMYFPSNNYLKWKHLGIVITVYYKLS